MLFEYVDKNFYFIKGTDNDKISYGIIHPEQHILYMVSIGYEYVESNIYDLQEDPNHNHFNIDFLTNNIQEIENMINNELPL